ncbi:hypothetical protein TrRE_jg2810 [Triparma retinervis]|uniref:Uncharacterized protein n=1 Tax=Triparma retinervis TaxID=2557542 RepID=A0A9W7G4S5_9STRA|nr:hypothetical protein TrRE_jg2810 [Triparma retinervis]
MVPTKPALAHISSSRSAGGVVAKRPSFTGLRRNTQFHRRGSIAALTEGARGKLLQSIQSKSQSSKYAADAAAEFVLSRWWRVYCFLCFLLGWVGQLGSLVGLFQTPHRWWYEGDNHFIYSQVTFITSTIFIYMNLSLSMNRPAGSTPRMLMMYPLVTLVYFTIFTKGVIWGLPPEEYINHVLNQCFHLVGLLFCPALRRYILRGGLGLIIKDISMFIVAYYSWIWQCFATLGSWPYDFLDMREKDGNIMFLGVMVGCYCTVSINYYLCVKVEQIMGGAANQAKTE